MSDSVEAPEQTAQEPQDPMAYLADKMGIEPPGSAKEAPKEAPKEAVAKTEKAPEKEEKAPEKAEVSAEDPLGMARAAIERKYKALAPTLLESMSDEQALAMGVQLAADLKQYSVLANERDRLITAQSSERHEDAETEQGGEEAARPSESESSLDISEILGSLDADLYEGLPDTLENVANALHQKGQAELKAGLEAMAERFESAHREGLDAEIRREMVERFPILRDPDVVVSLKETMALLEPGMAYPESMDPRERRARLMEHAMVLVDANAVVESQGKPSQRDKGGPRSPQHRGNPAPTPVDPATARKKYMQLRSSGMSVERAKADSGLLAES
jgi:hypothetical protein